MANEITKISTSLLPMEDIGVELSARGLITEAGTANDAENVGGISSDRIAISIEGNRETIDNSLKLGGKEASEYLTIEDGGQISENYNKIRYNYSDEVRNLRDELYQLKAELAKRGFVINRNSYSGYQEAFRLSDPIHEVSSLGEVVNIIGDINNYNEVEILPEVFSKIEIGDYIGLFSKNNSTYKICKIISMDETTYVIRFNIFINLDNSDSIEIYKSVGIINNGGFAFISEPGIMPSAHENQDSLKDISIRSHRAIDTNDSGFGYTFSINEEMFYDDEGNKYGEGRDGYLTKIKVKVEKVGAPGDLIMYVIPENRISDFKNPVQAENDGILLAKSNPLSVEVGGIKIATFDFLMNGQYPVLSLNEMSSMIGGLPGDVIYHDRFCMIISSTGGTDATNYYRVRFLNNLEDEGSLHENNDVYEYIRRDDLSLDMALITDVDINKGDLYYGVYTRGMESRSSTMYGEGLYTKKLKLDYPIEISRARLTLRINREGYYLASGSGTTININSETGVASSNYGFINVLTESEKDPMIIGSDIREGANKTVNTIDIYNNSIEIDGEIPFYRVGYKVYLKAKNETESINIELPLKAVMSDRVKYSNKISDRLIFEEDLSVGEEDVKYYNDFELQVYWKKGSFGDISEADYREDFIGKIHDLNLTFDKSI